MQFRELHLQAVNLSLMRNFYSFTLGLPVVAATFDTIMFQAGATRLVFRQGEPVRYHFAFNIPAGQIDAARDWVRERMPLARLDADQDIFHSESWQSSAIYFYDVAGNILEFIARRNLPETRPLPFGAGSILSVSEIGLATDDVPGLVAQLGAELSAPVFATGDGETFTAVGNDTGLCIVVKTGRIWFPETGIAAQPAPVQAVIAGAQAHTFTVPGYPYTFEVVS